MPCIEAKLASVSRDSITVELNTGEKFILPFDRYGYFRFCSIAELEHVTCDGFALEWPEAMIDLELDLLRHPERKNTNSGGQVAGIPGKPPQKSSDQENALRAAHKVSSKSGFFPNQW